MSASLDVTFGPPDEAYAELVSRVPDTLIQGSPEWARFLAVVCPAARPIYFMARNSCELLGALPAFEMEGPYGRVVNSLPYFGSHGDLIVATERDRDRVAHSLLGALGEHLRTQNVAALNIVAHPFRNTNRELLSPSYMARTDERIGQISILPRSRDRKAIAEALLANCAPKCRNLVRKGLKGGFQISVSDEREAWAALQHNHEIGMRRIGGIAKSRVELDCLRETFGPACRLWVASLEGEFAGALLTLVYREWVEYFMPVAVEAHRSKQVLSALIFAAMTQCAYEGLRYWNWGGTWRSQDGVYRFKRGWGAADYPYGYFGFAKMDIAASASPSDLRAGYPFFYVVPFSILKSQAPNSLGA